MSAVSVPLVTADTGDSLCDNPRDALWQDADDIHMSNAVPGDSRVTPLHLRQEDPELVAAQKPNRWLRLPQLSIPKVHIYTLLVFEAGSFGLRGALVKNTKHTAIIGAVAESSNVDFTRAIADVLAQLKQHQKYLPRRAVLLTPSVISSLVELPVSPLRPRSDSEMHELIRWELEGEMSQQNRRWLIGSMLVERGYLTVAQRDELVTELQVRLSQSASQAEPGSIVRFGDLAVEFNYITPQQLQECFALQGKLAAVDDELVFGWQAEERPLDNGPTDESLMSAEDDRESAHRWLVSGMSKSLRRRWVGAFALNHIKLEVLYPSLGACYATLSQYTQQPVQALLEIHQEQLAFICGSADGVRQLRIAERLQGDLRADEILALLADLPDSVNTVYLSTQGMPIDDLLYTLRTQLDLDYQIVSLGDVGIVMPKALHVDRLAGLAGVASHYFKHVRAARLSGVPARDKEPGVWVKLLQPKVLKVLAVLVVLAAMVGFMVWMHVNMWEQQARLAELDKSYERDISLKTQYDRIENEQTLLKQQIVQLSAEQLSNQRILELIVLEKPRRAVALSVLMKSISLHTPEGVTLIALRRIGKEIEIEAEALSQTGSMEFVNGLNQQLEPLAFQVKSSRIYRKDDEEGRVKSPGSNPSGTLVSGLPYRVEVVVLEGPPVSLDAVARMNRSPENKSTDTAVDKAGSATGDDT